MSATRELLIAIRMTLVLWVVTAIAYPLLILGIGQIALPYQANGSLIQNDTGTVIGSALIGQPYTRAEYFQSRPSAIDYSVGEAAAPTGLSGASNLAPGNPDLINRIATQLDTWRQAGVEPTADLVYTSGSGLDPHITPEGAIAQLDRIATARNLDPRRLRGLVEEHTEDRFLGIFGEPKINVLKLNLALDTL